MFKNIGGKIKSLATTLSLIGIVISCIFGVGLLFAGGEMGIFGIIFGAIGAVISWVSGFFTYGFGELIENTERIAANTDKLVKQGLLEIKRNVSTDSSADVFSSGASFASPHEEVKRDEALADEAVDVSFTEDA